jgi:glutaconate CoA-transferase subunit B
LICTIARLLDGVRHVAVGASSPIPAAGAVLLRALQQAAGVAGPRISILGSVEHNFFTNGSAELFDCAGPGRIDAFFLGGGQIDGRGNVNLVGTGDYPQSQVRWPRLVRIGLSLLRRAAGHPVPRGAHAPRPLSSKVDFIRAPGVSDDGVFRSGGPIALLTSKALFRFDKTRPGFELQSIHPGHDLTAIKDATGFQFTHDSQPGTDRAARPTDFGFCCAVGVLDEVSRDLSRLRRTDAPRAARDRSDSVTCVLIRSAGDRHGETARE